MLIKQYLNRLKPLVNGFYLFERTHDPLSEQTASHRRAGVIKNGNQRAFRATLLHA